ncbi:MAG: 3-dehydroquinate synthase [Nitrospirales bacterium]|nr:3-dehydroquinate synthase [Nitrospirales bacterium]
MSNTTQKVRVELGERSYDIVIDRGILPSLGERLREFRFTKVAVISNPTVFGLYGAQVMDSLEKAGFQPFPVLIPDGEGYKDYFWSYHILTELLKNGLDRKSCLIALGGGVIGDITGFAASIYMRGIPFIQVPTTLLSQVDSSVGGKTGVNHLSGKNMIGTFYQPKLVWIDMDVLKTLPKRELLCGIAEVIKYGVIWDSSFFSFLEDRRGEILALDPEAMAHIIRRSCEIKAEVVSHDERESGLRAILNYGHTIGHAIETETGYTRFNHGEGVAMGMYLEARLSSVMGFFDAAKVERIRQIHDSYGLPSLLPVGLGPERMLSHISLDKKTEGGRMTFILPEEIGKVRIEKGVGAEAVLKILQMGAE